MSVKASTAMDGLPVAAPLASGLPPRWTATAGQTK